MYVGLGGKPRVALGPEKVTPPLSNDLSETYLKFSRENPEQTGHPNSDSICGRYRRRSPLSSCAPQGLTWHTTY